MMDYGDSGLRVGGGGCEAGVLRPSGVEGTWGVAGADPAAELARVLGSLLREDDSGVLSGVESPAAAGGAEGAEGGGLAVKRPGRVEAPTAWWPGCREAEERALMAPRLL